MNQSSKPHTARRYWMYFLTFALSGIGTYTLMHYLFPRYSAKDLHELALIYQNDNTRKDILDIFAQVARSNSRFVRNSATRKFGWIGKREELAPKYLAVVYDNLFHKDIWTVGASVHALAQMERSELPPHVQLRLAEIIREHPGTSETRHAMETISFLKPESMQCADEIMQALKELSELDYENSKQAKKLYDSLKEQGL